MKFRNLHVNTWMRVYNGHKNSAVTNTQIQQKENKKKQKGSKTVRTKVTSTVLRLTNFIFVTF